MGIIRIGAEVKEGTSLSVKSHLRVKKTFQLKNVSCMLSSATSLVKCVIPLRVPHGADGVVRDVKIFTRANGDELQSGVNMLVRVYIAQNVRSRSEIRWPDVTETKGLSLVSFL